MAMSEHIPFNVRASGSFHRDTVYRIYLLHDVFYGITASRQSDMDDAWMARTDCRDPRDLMTQDEKNFSFHARDVLASSIEAPAPASGNDASFGIWKVRVKDRTAMVFRFETLQDIKLALHQIALPMGSRLAVNVTWDNENQVFIAK